MESVSLEYGGRIAYPKMFSANYTTVHYNREAMGLMGGGGGGGGKDGAIVNSRRSSQNVKMAGAVFYHTKVNELNILEQQFF
jgi:hypothetical protein